MISRIEGTLTQINDQYALVRSGGLSYEVLLPSALAEKLKDNGQVGSEISFETIYYIEAGDRKSNHYPRLVGFTNPIDREFFNLFTQVPGLGVKKALKSLVLPISEIAAAIETKESARLRRLPGVGGRLADKIIAELHGKTAKFALARNAEPLAATKPAAQPFVDEALEILLQLQYSTSEAKTMIEKAVEANPKVDRAEHLISIIFKSESEAKGDN
jgi:Holliday junction DNA helicase RuvA